MNSVFDLVRQTAKTTMDGIVDFMDNNQKIRQDEIIELLEFTGFVSVLFFIGYVFVYLFGSAEIKERGRLRLRELIGAISGLLILGALLTWGYRALQSNIHSIRDKVVSFDNTDWGLIVIVFVCLTVMALVRQDD